MPSPAFDPPIVWQRAAPHRRNRRSKPVLFESGRAKRPKGFGLKAKSGLHKIQTPLGYRKDELSNQRATEWPHFQRRPFRNLAGCRHPSRHWLALWLQRWRMWFLQMQKSIRHCGSWRTSSQSPQRRGRSTRAHLDMLLYCAKRCGPGITPSDRRRQLSHQKNASARGQPREKI